MKRYTQVAMPLPRDHSAYTETLAQARQLRADVGACLIYLQEQLATRSITIHDARTIWRGLYSVWETPFGE